MARPAELATPAACGGGRGESPSGGGPRGGPRDVSSVEPAGARAGFLGAGAPVGASAAMLASRASQAPPLSSKASVTTGAAALSRPPRPAAVEKRKPDATEDRSPATEDRP